MKVSICLCILIYSTFFYAPNLRNGFGSLSEYSTCVFCSSKKKKQCLFSKTQEKSKRKAEWNDGLVTAVVQWKVISLFEDSEKSPVVQESQMLRACIILSAFCLLSP